MSLLTKYNLREHCRTCLKHLSSSAGITSTATNANEAPDNKELFFNIYKDAELQQLICIYVDGQYKNETPSSSDHDFPENVCRVCFDKLHNFALFRRRAQQSAEKLRTVLNSNDSMIKVEIAYDENQQEQQQHKEVTPESREYDYRLKVDALMENEEVFFGTSAESPTEAEENDDCIMDPFSPSAQSLAEECSSSKELAEAEEDTMKPVPCTLDKKKKINCMQCTQSYNTNSELEAHVREHHSAPTELSFSCDHCDKEYRFTRSLQEHMKHKHPDQLYAKGQFKCTECPKGFPTHLSLKKHMCFHIRKDMARVCGVCDKRFPVKNLLIEHLRTHTSDGRIPCGQCDKSFLWYQDLLNHETASHLKEKPFPCKLCDKSFQTQKSLRFHSYRHSGEKPYLCEVCGKDFRQPTAMKQHRLSHFKSGDKNEKSEKS